MSKKAEKHLLEHIDSNEYLHFKWAAEIMQAYADEVKEKYREEMFNDGFDEGYTSPMEMDLEPITGDKYKQGRKANYIQYLETLKQIEK